MTKGVFFVLALAVLEPVVVPADLQAQDIDARLRAAAKLEDTNAVKALMAQGAKVDSQDQHGQTAIMLAAFGGHLLTVQTLLSTCKTCAEVDVRDNEGTAALTYAAINGHTPIVWLLSSKGAAVDLQDNEGDTALLWASRQGHVDTVNALLASKASVDKTNKYHDTPLIEAAGEGHEPIIQILLKAGAKIDMKGDDGDTALIRASGAGRTPAVQALLTRGAAVNAQNDFGFTALIAAAIKCSEPTVRALLAKGADVTLKTSSGATAVVAAESKNCTSVVPLLKTQLQTGPATVQGRTVGAVTTAVTGLLVLPADLPEYLNGIRKDARLEELPFPPVPANTKRLRYSWKVNTAIFSFDVIVSGNQLLYVKRKVPIAVGSNDSEEVPLTSTAVLIELERATKHEQFSNNKAVLSWLFDAIETFIKGQSVDRSLQQYGLNVRLYNEGRDLFLDYARIESMRILEANSVVHRTK